MTVAAAVKITAEDQDFLIAVAAKFAAQRGEPCFVISIVPSLSPEEEHQPAIERNLQLITSRSASPVLQEGDDVPSCLRQAAEKFGVSTLFIQNGRRRFRRSLAERLIHLKPSFQVVVVAPQD